MLCAEQLMTRIEERGAGHQRRLQQDVNELIIGVGKPPTEPRPGWTLTSKVRYRGLAKNTARLTMLFALGNVWMARRKILGAQG